MRAIPYALSVHHFISTVGADAGFAAIIGLAIVVLLFFAHARETASLRRRADESEDALRRLEQYVDQLSRSAPAPAAPPPSATPRPRPAVSSAAAAWAGTAAPVASRTVDPARPVVGATAGAPGAPAGVGAPALSAATRLIPASDDTVIAISANRSPALAGSGSATGATAAAVMDPPGPPPSTTAGGANGNRIPPAPPPALPPASAQTMGGRERTPDAARPRPGATRAPVPAGQRRRSGQRPGGSRIGRGAIVLATALVVVVVVGVLLVVTNSGGSKGTTTAAGQTTRQSSTSPAHKGKAKTKSAAAVSPASVTVAVINGTSTTNLAHDISQKLTAAGYKPGHLATATDQTQTSTIVGYLVSSDKRDALAVAKSLKLGPAAVQAVDPNNRTLACGATTSCPAQVIVTVGSDLASNA